MNIKRNLNYEFCDCGAGYTCELCDLEDSCSCSYNDSCAICEGF